MRTMVRLLSLLLVALLLVPSASRAARGFGTTDGVASTDVITTTYASGSTTFSWMLSVWRTGPGGANLGRMFSKDNGTTERREFYHSEGSATYNLRVSWTGTDGEWTIARPTAGAWHHILITYNGGSAANDPIIYVDGSSVTVTRTDAPTGALETGTMTAYHIGNSSLASTRVFDGRLAEVAVWESLLTSGNATSLWNGGRGARANTIGTPVQYWRLCGASPEPNEMGGGSSASVTGTASIQTSHVCSGFTFHIEKLME
jgi:hypothetical protein